MGKTVAELATHIGAKFTGDGTTLIFDVGALHSAEPGSVVFLEDAALIEQALRSRASCVIVPEGTACEGGCFIHSAHPKLAFARIAELLYRPEQPAGGIHTSAVVANSAKVGERVQISAGSVVGEDAVVGPRTRIGPGVIVGDGVSIGCDCVIYGGAVLYPRSTLGDRVILHAGVIIGGDGFGYVRDGNEGYVKFPQIGSVLIEDDVEIGANSCVDRGALGQTRIGKGTKIDNLVQVAHNVDIGERVIIAAQTGISGSTVIEDDAVIGGQVGLGDHARVSRGAVIGSKAGILPGKVVRAGEVMWGIPVRPLSEYKRLNALFGRLPQMKAEIDELKRQLEELKRRDGAK